MLGILFALDPGAFSAVGVPATALYTAEADDAIRPAARSNAESERAIELVEPSPCELAYEVREAELVVGDWAGASENSCPKLGT